MVYLTGYTQIAGGDTSQIDTDATQGKQHQLGTRMMDRDGMGEFIYLRGVGSTVAGTTVVYDEAGYTVRIDGNGSAPSHDGPVAIAMAAIDATTSYGWYQIFGKNTIAICSDDVADNEQCYAVATPGQIDDADAGTGYAIVGMWFRSANTAGAGGTATVQLNYPSIHTDAFD